MLQLDYVIDENTLHGSGQESFTVVDFAKEAK